MLNQPGALIESEAPNDENFHKRIEHRSIEQKYILISKYIEKILYEIKNGRISPPENIFYLNSSDSLESLMNMDLKDKKVLTVSGSGEFAHAFISAGAKEVCNFDISAAAIFYSELRQVALCELEMQDYVRLFGSWIKNEENKNSKEEKPILDINVYKKIETKLSEEARIYFELLFKTPELLIYEKYKNLFSQARSNKKIKYDGLIGGIIKDEAQYETLREKAKAITFKLTICDITDTKKTKELIEKYKPNLIYISNIGYSPDKTIALAIKLIELGVTEVICTINSVKDGYFSSPYDSEGFYYSNKKLELNSKFVFESYDEETDEVREINAEVVGIDKNANFGLTLKITK